MSKTFRKVQEVEELPSFLLHLTAIPEDVSFPPRPTISDLYLGPVFFGKCNENHPPLHSVNFNTFRHIEKPYQAKENINHLFLPKTVVEKPVNVSKPFRLKPVLGGKHINFSTHLHRSPGTRRAFGREVKPRVIDLGESTSVIEGETVMEIPVYRLKKIRSKSSVQEFELVNFSDIKEKKRMLMPYNERISHIHFPKEFATVTVVGPAMPAAITITKLPSKRKTQSVGELLNTAKIRKSSTKAETDEEKTEEVTKEPEEADFSVEGDDSTIFSVEGSIDTEKNLVIQIIEEEKDDDTESGLQEFSSEQNEEDITETKGINNEDIVESDGKHPVEEMEGTEVIEKSDENEEQQDGNPEEEEEEEDREN